MSPSLALHALPARDWTASLAAHALVLAALWWAAGLAPAPHSPHGRRLDIRIAHAPPSPPQDASVPAAPPARTQPRPAPPLAAPAARPRPAPLARAPAVPAAAPAGAPDAAPPAETAPASPATDAAAAPLPPQAEASAAAPVDTAPPVPVSPAADGERAYRQWRQRLEQALHQHKRYPPAARRLRQSGTVLVHLKLDARGVLVSCAVADSSGFRVLDDAAEHAVRSVVLALQSEQAPGRAAELRIPIVYELTES